jgi:rubrerythrin
MTFSGPEVIEMAVQTEKGGKLYYETVAAASKDEKLKGIFLMLADAEKHHIAVFDAIGKTIPARPEGLPYNWDDAVLYLKAITDSRYFLGAPDKALALARTAATTAEALQHAIGFEKETLLFYLEIREMVKADSRAAVEKLIAEEKGHIRQLTEIRHGMQL